MRYLLFFLFISTQIWAQNNSDWKFFKCPDKDITKLTLIKYGETKEDVYLGTTEECAQKQTEDPDEVNCYPLVQDNIINSYLKNKEIYDELQGKNSLIVNPTVYSATIEFHAKYLFKRDEVAEPITFYVFHSPEFCRGGWIDMDRGSDGSVFIQSAGFERSIYYMSMTTIKKMQDSAPLQSNQETQEKDSDAKEKDSNSKIILEGN